MMPREKLSNVSTSHLILHGTILPEVSLLIVLPPPCAIADATVSQSFSKALVKARMAKKMNQKALAQAINEKPQVINQYESGKAIPNGQIINKLNRALGCQLPKAKGGGGKKKPTKKK